MTCKNESITCCKTKGNGRERGVSDREVFSLFPLLHKRPKKMSVVEENFDRLAIGDDDSDAVVARWAATLEEAKRQAARHATERATGASREESWVDVSDHASTSIKQSTSTSKTLTTSTTAAAVPRDSGDAWRQEEWHIAFIVLVKRRRFVFCLATDKRKRKSQHQEQLTASLLPLSLLFFSPKL